MSTQRNSDPRRRMPAAPVRRASAEAGPPHRQPPASLRPASPASAAASPAAASPAAASLHQLPEDLPVVPAVRPRRRRKKRGNPAATGVSVLAIAVTAFGLWVVWRQVQPPPPTAQPAAADVATLDRGENPMAAPPPAPPRPPSRMDQPPRQPMRQSKPAATPPPTAPPAAPLPDIDDELSAALVAMNTNDFAAAEQALQAAEAKASLSPAAERVAAWQELLHYARGYQDLQTQALDDVGSGNEYDIASGKVGIIESTPERLSYIYRGTTQRVVRDKIPQQIVDAILTDWLDERPANRLYVGAHHFTQQPPDRDAAREAWEMAAAGGADASGLLSLLDDPAAP